MAAVGVAARRCLLLQASTWVGWTDVAKTTLGIGVVMMVYMLAVLSGKAVLPGDGSACGVCQLQLEDRWGSALSDC